MKNLNYLNTFISEEKGFKSNSERLIKNLADLSAHGLERLKQAKFRADSLAEYNRRAMALQIFAEENYHDYCEILRLAIDRTAPVTHLVVPRYNEELFCQPQCVYLKNGDVCLIYRGLHHKGYETRNEICRILQNEANHIASIKGFGFARVHLVLKADNRAIFGLSPLRCGMRI